ncbi:MFS transporter [Streptomyces sp. NPDC088353]|uniref:MFS transporter n=1 Tax=Streptomyces sp. NPDC088353 TaxID=3365855 RepID=UPI003828C72F
MQGPPHVIPSETTGPVGRARAVAAVTALTLALFVYSSVQSLPIGLLPQIASGLNVPESSVGLLVTGYGLVVAVTAVPLTGATRSLPRRRLLTALLILFAAATSLSALAPGYGVLLAAQILIALTHAVFLSVIAATATGMFREAVRAKVVGALFSGIPLASAVGVPAGTWLGQRTEWRVPFLVMSALGLVAGVAVALLLPSAPAGRDPVSIAPRRSRSRFALLMAATGLVVAGVFTFYTYVAVFLTRATGLSSGTVSVVLLLNGLAGLAGTCVSGALSDRNARATMTGTVVLLAAALTVLAGAGSRPWAAVTAVAVLGLALAALLTALQSRILRTAPRSVEVASAAGSATINAGIAGGALLGGHLLEAPGLHSIALTGACLTAAGLAALLVESERPKPSEGLSARASGAAASGWRRPRRG